jgi:hypothetical protein
MLRLFLVIFLFSQAAYAEDMAVELTKTEQDQLRDRGWRDRRDGELGPLVRQSVRPPDYIDDHKRGLVEFSESRKNFSRHRVLIPNGSVVVGKNFSQHVPNSDVIVRDKANGNNLTFKDCNLVNVKTYADWIIEDSNTAQILHEEVDVYDEKNNVVGKETKATWLAKSVKDFEAI